MLDDLGVDSTEKKTVGRGRRQHTREEPLFTYSGLNVVDDVIGNFEQASARIQQVAVGTGGSAEAALGVTVTSVGCGTVAGCVLSGPLGTWLASDGADTAWNASQALSSDYEYKNGARVRDSFTEATNQEAVSPTVELLTNVGVNVAGGVIAKRAGALVLREELPTIPNMDVVSNNKTSTQRAEKTVSGADQPLEPTNPNRAQHGHGNAEHGFQTTPSQQEQRIITGVKPSGQQGNQTSKASKFLTPEAEAEALGRGRRQLDYDVQNKKIPKMVNGEPNRHAVTVETTRAGGFGERWVRAKDSSGQNLKDENGNFIPQKDPVQLKRSKLIFEYVPSTDKWEPVTYFPVQ